MQSELPLWKDQINSVDWIKHCDYAFDFWGNEWFVQSQPLKKFSLPDQIGKSGVIFCGTTQPIVECLANIPKEGNYILVTRDNDTSITEDIYRKKPESVKHWFAINCAVNHPDITAIPYGTNNVGGQSKTLENACEENKKEYGSNKIWVCFTIPPILKNNHERHRCRNVLSKNPDAIVKTEFVDQYENFAQMRKHKYVACPVGHGADTLRIWESIACGAIPILNDIPEMWHFHPLPVKFTKDWVYFSEESGYSTELARMSYWENELRKVKGKYAIH